MRCVYQRLLFHRYKWSWTHFVFYSTNLPYFCSISNHLSVIGLKCFDSFICWVSCVSSWHTSCIFYPSVALFCLQYDNTNQSSFVISFLDLLKYCPVFISVNTWRQASWISYLLQSYRYQLITLVSFNFPFFL